MGVGFGPCPPPSSSPLLWNRFLEEDQLGFEFQFLLLLPCGDISDVLKTLSFNCLV